MALHTAGQLTWPEPLVGARCGACRHFAGLLPRKSDIGPRATGTCRLVKAMTGLRAHRFDSPAIACPQFKGAA